jgi:hypothetical protein
MEKENLIDHGTTAVNLKLSEKMNDNNRIPHGLGEGAESPATKANLKIQEAFYNENDLGDSPPTYVTNETAAIKITGNNK